MVGLGRWLAQQQMARAPAVACRLAVQEMAVCWGLQKHHGWPNSCDCTIPVPSNTCVLVYWSCLQVKPDGVHRGMVGDIIRRFEQRGYKLVGIKVCCVFF